jgi:Low-density lipoprotein receptor repeat class B
MLQKRPTPRALPIRRRPALGAALFFALACLVFASTAAAESRLYWSNNASGSIATANRAGGEVIQKLFFASPEPYGITADSTHVYWTDESTDEIGRAELNGANVEPSLIPAAGEVPEGMAVDDGHVYWANLVGQAIGRSNLDGSNPEPNFLQLSAASFPEGVAIEGSHIYWTAAGHGGEIGRSNLAGGEIEEELITGLGGAISALAADPTHLYWSTNVGVGRAALDGEEVEKNLVTGQTSVGGVAVDNEHVFWASFTTNRIGRAELDGGTVEPNFITGAEAPDTITVSTNPTTTAGGTSATSVTEGETVRGTATVGGGEATRGTINFKVYGPGDETCAAAPVETLAVAVAGNGSYESPAFEPTEPGTYHWVAEYEGDAINAPSASDCATGAFTVKAAPKEEKEKELTPGPGPTPEGMKSEPVTAVTPVLPVTAAPNVASGGAGLGPLRLRKVTRNHATGIGHIAFQVPSAGRLTISGPGVETRSVTAAGAGPVVAMLVPKGSYAAHLRTNHRGFTKVTVSFQPTAGTALPYSRQVRLVKR